MMLYREDYYKDENPPEEANANITEVIRGQKPPRPGGDGGAWLEPGLYDVYHLGEKP